MSFQPVEFRITPADDMSLWKVPDDATRELMVNFYQRIINGEPRADALLAAQNDLRRTYEEPYFWGAFVCLGNPGPLPDRLI